MSTADLRTAFEAYRAENPKARIRTAATALNTTEAELVATGVDGEAVALTAPDGKWRALLPEIETFGDVMALTRNDACVHEKHGTYHNVEIALPHGMALVTDEEIDLRLFCVRWASAFAVATPMGEGKQRRSLQFFDRHGDAVHKVFLTEASDEAAYDAFVAAHRAEGDVALDITPRPEPKADRPDSEVDADAFIAGWDALKDTHDFFPLIGTHKVGRTQALRLAEGRYTERVPQSAARAALEAAAETQTPIMVFVGNPGGIQIHTGPVEKLVQHGPWFNVLDPRFNLHLDETQIAEAWIVVKPTEDGDVTALEAYDANGQQIVQLFGKRKPGVPELESWREIVAGLPRLGVEA